MGVPERGDDLRPTASVRAWMGRVNICKFGKIVEPYFRLKASENCGGLRLWSDVFAFLSPVVFDDVHGLAWGSSFDSTPAIP